MDKMYSEYLNNFIVKHLLIFNSKLLAKHFPVNIIGFMFFCFIHFRRSKEEVHIHDINHEVIHVKQYLQCFVLGCIPAMFLWVIISAWFLLLPIVTFYILYITHYTFLYIRARLILKANSNAANDYAYYNNCFEREAYENDNDMRYPDNMLFMNALRYLDSDVHVL